jgi:hypothetical protein
VISVPLRAASASLNSKELFLGVTPGPKHRSLLASYVLTLKRGPVAVRDTISADLRAFIDLGAQRRAADLLIVLRLFLSKYPEAKYGRSQLTHGGNLTGSFSRSTASESPDAERTDHARTRRRRSPHRCVRDRRAVPRVCRRSSR